MITRDLKVNISKIEVIDNRVLELRINSLRNPYDRQTKTENGQKIGRLRRKIEALKKEQDNLRVRESKYVGRASRVKGWDETGLYTEFGEVISA